jgi:hypothetical protein
MVAGGSSPRDAGPDELGVLISAGGGEPDHLVMLGRPVEGHVHLREWSTHNWSGAPDERDVPVAQAYAIFQRAYDARRRMTAALPEIRAWLDGRRV